MSPTSCCARVFSAMTIPLSATFFHGHPRADHEPGNAVTPREDHGCSYARLMDNRSEVRDFLTTRRGRLTPEQAGITPFGGARRVPGLRREELALLADVAWTTTYASNAET